MTKLNVSVVGLDVGYRWTKITANGEDFYLSPSVVALAGDQVDASAMFKGIDPVEYNGQSYLVGRDTIGQSRLFRQTLNRLRLGTDEFIVLALNALARVYPGGHKSIRLVTGLPHRDLADQDDLKSRLLGNHTFNGDTFKIVGVEVLPQTLGTLLSEAFEFYGGILNVVDRGLLEKPSLIIDYGGLTVGLQKFVDRRYVAAASDSLPFGMSRVIEALRPYLRRIGLEEGQYDPDQLVKQGYVETASGVHDLSDVINPAAEEIARAIHSRATALWDQGADAPNLLHSGGGAPVFAEPFNKLYQHPNPRLVKEHQVANAKGFYYYALAMWSK